MRKVVVYELLSLDGVAERPDGFFADWDDAMDANLGAVIAALELRVPLHEPEASDGPDGATSATVRPSTMTAASTPPSTAARQVSTLGIMPP